MSEETMIIYNPFSHQPTMAIYIKGLLEWTYFLSVIKIELIT